MKTAVKEARKEKLAKEKKISPQKAEEQKAYNEYVKEVTPTHSLPKNMAKAFFVV